MWWGAPMSNFGYCLELLVTAARVVQSKGTQQGGSHPFPMLRTIWGAAQSSPH